MRTDIREINWKEYRGSFQDKAEIVLQRLTLQEKVSLMSGSMTKAEVRAAIQGKRKTHYNEVPYKAGGLLEHGIAPVYFADGTRGVVCGRGETTCFPVAVMRGASFDPDLEREIGNAIAEEVLAAGANLFAGICVNLPYHPGWGRSQEAYGEDSCLLGEMGAALIRGVQEKGVIACVKHFAFNSMEDVRFDVNIICDKRTEQEVFLPHFRKCVEAGAGAVMSSYNSYQGTMCGQHDYLLNQVLKKEWGFDGFVMCDFNWGIKDTVKAVNSGQDLEMPNTYYYGENLIRAVEQGQVDETKVNESALRIIRTILSHQAFLRQGDKERQLKAFHAELALKSARAGITLLRNRNQLLPLSTGKGQIVVLGCLADQENTGDKGSSQVYPPYVVTILQGIVKAVPDAEVVYYPGNSLTHCRRLAKKADQVIIVAGSDYHDEGEYVSREMEDLYTASIGGDRKDGLGLKEHDLAIIDAVGGIREDAVVVLMGGGMFTMAEWQDKTGAILLCYYPGMEGGTAVGEVLFGAVNPSGKLPFVIAQQESDLPTIDWNAKEQYYGYEHGYVLLEKNEREPLYPFGFGLSYTTFCMDHHRVWYEDTAGFEVGDMDLAERLCASVRVKNTGMMSGAEVVQMYVGSPARLRAFQRVELGAGDQKEVTLYCNLRDLMIYDEKRDQFIKPILKQNVYIGNNSRDVLKFNL